MFSSMGVCLHTLELCKIWFLLNPHQKGLEALDLMSLGNLTAMFTDWVTVWRCRQLPCVLDDEGSGRPGRNGRVGDKFG